MKTNLIRNALRQGAQLSRTPVRKCSTTSDDVATKSMINVPAWGLVVLGTTAAGFFGKVLHDDNLETRRELGKMADRLDGRIDRVEAKMDKISDKVDNGFKDLADKLQTPRMGK